MGDAINGAGGTDKLNIFGNANAGRFDGANITNVEVINAQMTNGGGLDVSNNADVEQAWIANGSRGNNSVDLTMAQTGGIQGTVGGAALAVKTFNFTDASALTNDAATIALKDADVGSNAGSGVTIGGNNVETLTLAAQGDNSIGNLADAALKTLNVTGAGSVEATVTGANVKTVDASTNTGGVDLNLAASAGQTQTITTGSGDDSITTTFAALVAGDTINLGAGSDKLLFTDAATIMTAADAKKLSGVSGVEVLGTIGTTLTLDGDLVTQTQFSTSGAGDFQITDAAQGTTLSFGEGVAGSSSVAMKLGANTLNVELNGSAAGAADVLGGLLVTGSLNVNILSTGEAGVGANDLYLLAADNQNVVLTGSQDITLDVDNISSVTGATINASAFTGNANINGTVNADIIIGGAGDDVLIGDGGGDVMTGGAGADQFVIQVSGLTAADADIVLDFSADDTISFSTAGVASGTAGVVGNYSEGAAAVADFTTALAAANAAFDTTVVFNAQQVGADLWVFHDADANGTFDAADNVVKLAGVSLADFAFGDIVA